MRREQLEYAAARYGTPLYIFDMDILNSQIDRLRKILGEETGLCYAMKANPFLTREMADRADRIEVCSMGEFEICRKLEIPPEKLFISGVMKKKEDIFRILDTYGERCRYTVESVKQMHYFLEWSDAHMKEIRLYPRLTNGSQFGMDEDTVRSMFGIVNMSPYLKIEGIHFFSGTQKRHVRQFRQELEMLDRGRWKSLNWSTARELLCRTFGEKRRRPTQMKVLKVSEKLSGAWRGRDISRSNWGAPLPQNADIISRRLRM